jgi:hypothetical protein
MMLIKSLILSFFVLTAWAQNPPTDYHKWQDSNTSANESGMAPYQLQLQREIEYRNQYDLHKANEQKRFIFAEKSGQQIVYNIRSLVHCQAENEFSIPVPARGKTFYWKFKSTSGSAQSNEKGVLDFQVPAKVSDDLASELRLSLDSDGQKPLSLTAAITVPASVCDTKSIVSK